MNEIFRLVYRLRSNLYAFKTESETGTINTYSVTWTALNHIWFLETKSPAAPAGATAEEEGADRASASMAAAFDLLQFEETGGKTWNLIGSISMCYDSDSCCGRRNS